MRWLLLFFAVSVQAQTLTFSPMDRAAVPQLKDSAVAWTVMACAPPGSTIPGGRILQAFAKHGTPIMREIAVDMIHRHQGRSFTAVTLKILAGMGAVAAVGATVQQKGDLSKSRTAQKVVTWGGVVAAGSLVLKPYVESELPKAPTAVEGLLLTDRLSISDAGCATAAFFARKTGKEVGFTEVLGGR